MPASLLFSKTFNHSKSGRRNLHYTSMQGWIGRGMNKTTEAQKIIMRRRDQLNIELMQVLEQESAAETVREL